MTYYINVYQIPNGGPRWLGQPIESKALSNELAANGNVLYRLRIKLKDATA